MLTLLIAMEILGELPLAAPGQTFKAAPRNRTFLPRPNARILPGASR